MRPPAAAMRETQALAGLWVLWLALLLGACASPTSPATFARAEPLDGAVESPARKRARIRLELAMVYHQQGQDGVALEEVRQALSHDPQWAPAWTLRGLIHLRQADWRQAQHSLERAVALAPGDADAAHNLGWMLCQHPEVRWAEAEPLLQRSLSLPGAQPAKTWTALGLCQQRAGRWVQAERSLRQALALEPGSVRANWPLAQVLAAQDRWREAFEVLDRLHAGQGASAESLWLAVRAARKLDNAQAFGQAAQQLRQEFGQSRQAQALDKGWFDE